MPERKSYRHWAQMEIDQHEWAKAFEAAEKGMQIVGETRQLLFLAAFARSRYGRELASRLQQGDAKVSLSISQQHLGKALKAPVELSSFSDRQLNANIYRTLVLNCEAVGDVEGMREHFEAWMSEHPDDPAAQSEWERLALKYHLSRRPAVATK